MRAEIESDLSMVLATTRGSVFWMSARRRAPHFATLRLRVDSPILGPAVQILRTQLIQPHQSGVGTPRSLQGRAVSAIFGLITRWVGRCEHLLRVLALRGPRICIEAT